MYIYIYIYIYIHILKGSSMALPARRDRKFSLAHIANNIYYIATNSYYSH